MPGSYTQRVFPVPASMLATWCRPVATYRLPSNATGVASNRLRWRPRALAISLSGEVQRHAIRKSRALLVSMSEREEYFVFLASPP